jgi:hypothetical protein
MRAGQWFTVRWCGDAVQRACVVRYLCFPTSHVPPHEPHRPASSESLIGTPLRLSEVRCRTSPWPIHAATTSRTISSATSYPLIAAGSLCRRRAALTATSTATAVGPSALCGVRAMADIWRGAAGPANSSTRHNRAALPNPRTRPGVDARRRTTAHTGGMTVRRVDE